MSGFSLYRAHGRGAVALIFSVSLMLLGCGDLDREHAGGTDDSGSLLNVEDIDPVYFDQVTDQVDIIRDNCETDPTKPPKPEDFTDHYADVMVTNRPLPNHEDQTASWVYLESYTLQYTPVSSGAPALAPLNRVPLGQTVGIPPCEPGGGSCTGTTFRVMFVPVALKADLASAYTGNQFQYNVHYTFYGENDFGEDVSAEAFSSFVADDYDNCGGG